MTAPTKVRRRQSFSERNWQAVMNCEGRMLEKSPGEPKIGSSTAASIVALALFGLVTSAGLSGESPRSSPGSDSETSEGSTANPLERTETTINSLWEVTEDLHKAVKDYHRHLDAAVAAMDKGPQSADSALSRSDAGIALAALRLSFAARTVAAAEQDHEFKPAVLSDLRRIEEDIRIAGQRMNASDAANRELLTVSPAELKNGTGALKKARHPQLLKARAAAEAESVKAVAVLPVALPSRKSEKDPALRLIFLQHGQNRAPAAEPTAETPKPASAVSALADAPIHFDLGQRVTLVNEGGYRLAFTDLGTDHKRHLFYQEEWVQRGRALVQNGWLTAVNLTSGEHVLVRQYAARELAGNLDDLYALEGWNETRSALAPDDKPAGEIPDPSDRKELEPVLAEVERLPNVLLGVRQHYMDVVQAGLALSDARSRRIGQGALDAGLPDGTRVSLYAIRGHLLRDTGITRVERQVREAAMRANERVDILRSLAAWTNRPNGGSNEDGSSGGGSTGGGLSEKDADKWDALQNRSDDAIFMTRKAIRLTLEALPRDLSEKQGKFPELFPNGVVHMVGIKTSGKPGQAIWQEVWDLDNGGKTARHARQRIDTFIVDPEYQGQVRLTAETKYYPMEPGETLIEAYDRLGGPVAPPEELTIPAGYLEKSRPATSKRNRSTVLDSFIQLADPTTVTAERRAALRYVAERIAAEPNSLSLDWLQLMADRSEAIDFLRSEVNRNNSDAGRVLSALPASPNVPRAEILAELFAKIPSPLASNGATFLWAWRQVSDATPPEEYLLFIRALVGGATADSAIVDSKKQPLDQQHAAEAFRRLHQDRYRKLLLHDNAALQSVLRFYKTVQRVPEPSALDPTLDLLAALNTNPDVQVALRTNLDLLANKKPFSQATPQQIASQRERIFWALDYTPVNLKDSDTLDLRGLLSLSALIDADVDPDARDALNARVDALVREVGLQCLPQLFGDMMSQVKDQLLPGDIRMAPPLFEAMDRFLFDSLRATEEDAELRQDLMHYIGFLIDRPLRGPDEALQLLYHLLGAESENRVLQNEVKPHLLSWRSKLEKTDRLNPSLRELRIEIANLIGERLP